MTGDVKQLFWPFPQFYLSDGHILAYILGVSMLRLNASGFPKIVWCFSTLQVHGFHYVFLNRHPLDLCVSVLSHKVAVLGQILCIWSQFSVCTK